MKEYILSVNPCIYGLNYHDPGAAIISDGEVLFAIEEERLNGIKGSKGLFPSLAIQACLDYCGITKNQINCVTLGYNPDMWMQRLQLELDDIVSKNMSHHSIEAKNVMERIIDSNLVERYKFYKNLDNVINLMKSKTGIDNATFKFFDHHLCHVASSYEYSHFDEAVGVVIDGIGENECTTIWEIRNHKYKKIMSIKYPNSLGYFYAIATKFLGFEPWHHEGKTMALAAYGHENRELMEKLDKVIRCEKDVYDVSEFIISNSTNYLMIDEEKALQSLENVLGIKRRKNNEPVEDIYKDFAWAVQNILEKAVVKLIDYAVNITGMKNVCVAGGIFMNCKMNMVVREQSSLTNYFVQPLAGDMGLILGSGILASNKFPSSELSLYLGNEYSDEEIEAVLKKEGVTYYWSADIAKEVATLLSEGKIVCWFEGRMECGARALGGRSILGDPRTIHMSDKINETVKHREVWRPFACSVLEEHFAEIFEKYEHGKKYSFMIEAFKVNKEWTGRIPAVIHRADGTSRPQMVSKDSNPLYHSLIEKFYSLTGCPLVLNTSFNDKGQPIVLTPQLAIDFLHNNNVDALAIGNFLVLQNN